MKTQIMCREIVASILLPGIIGLGLMTTSAHAQEREEKAPPPPREGRGPGGPSTRPAAARVDLEHVMESMGRTLKRLEKQVKDDAKIDSSLVMVAELEQLSLTAKGATPKQINKLPENQRAEALADYKKMMGSLLSAFTDLESAIIDKEAKKIDEAINTIHEIEKNGHDELKVKQEKEHD